MKKTLVKAIVSGAIILVLISIGYLIYQLSKLSGNSSFYLPYLTITILTIGVWLVCWSLNLLKKKIAVSSLIIILLASSISIIYYHSQNTKATEITEYKDKLWEYEPFAINTKSVYLDKPSSLKLDNNLPRIDGATAFYPTYAAFVQAVYPEKRYNLNSEEVKCSKTPGAYKKLIEGEVDLIFCFAPSEEQLEEANEKGITLELTAIGKEAFIFFVNKENKVNNLTSDQIKAIYSGDITSWKTIGGTNDKILAYQRPSNSGSQTMLTNIMGDITIMDPPANTIIHGMGDIIERTSSYKNYQNAIGYSFLYYATKMVNDNKIKILEIDSIYPSKNTIRSNKYPFTAEFYAIKTNKNRNKNVDLLIDWIKSPEGQYLIEKSGYTAIY